MHEKQARGSPASTQTHAHAHTHTQAHTEYSSATYLQGTGIIKRGHAHTTLAKLMALIMLQLHILKTYISQYQNAKGQSGGVGDKEGR